MLFEADEFTARRPAGTEIDFPDSGTRKPERDWKRTFLIFGLGALSWVATYVGMLELIQSNMGDLPLIHKLIIGFSVAMLMTMIIWLLDQLFRPHTFLTKLFYAGGYIFLTIISVGFGFGFYWKVLESRSEASRSAESAVTQVQSSLQAASTRLEQLNATLVQLTSISTAKAELERTKGTSCPNSRPGDGPRRKMRDDDAQRFSFASEFVKGRIGTVKGDMTALNGDLKKVVSADPSTFDAKTGTRNEFMRALGHKLDMTVTGFNAFRTDPQLRQIRSDLADRADRTTFSDGRGGNVSCPDPQLQTALHGVVKAIDQLPELEKPEVAAVEGAEATIEAFRRLTTTFYGLLSFKLPPSADELRELQKKAIQSVEGGASQAMLSASEGGLSKRDYVPLAVAIFVDLCLLLVSMVQRSGNRLDSLVPKMQIAERGPVIQILSRFNDIHKDRQIRENFEIFRHVVFDMNGDYYVAVPLDAPPRLNPKEREELRVEAQLLANLFASFEKEKIFKRTMLPTTSSIQKRLRRQGSKFAGSEAFRVYKFTDGAWSDIILGAIMGAARRAEISARAARPIHAENAVSHALPDARPSEASNAQATAVSESTAPTKNPETPPFPEHQEIPSRPHSHAENSFERKNFDREMQSPRKSYTSALLSPDHVAPKPPKREPSLSMDPEHVTRFGPYAHVYRPEQNLEPRRQAPPFATAPQGPRVAWPEPVPPPEADVTVHNQTASERSALAHASSTTPKAVSNVTTIVAKMDVPDANEASNEIQNAPMSKMEIRPALQTQKHHAIPHDRIDVTVRRETATFSVPVSEARLPSALQAALQNAAPQPLAIEAETEAQTIEEAETIESAPAIELPPPLPSHPSRLQSETPDMSELTDDDIAFISRIAPEAAE